MQTVIIARGQGFENQVEKCTKYALKKGYEIGAVTDSIYNVFQPILNNEVDIILTTDMSRITRQEREYYKIKEVLNNNAVDLVIVPKPTTETLSYNETIEVIRKYGRELYDLFYKVDCLFAGREVIRTLKSLERTPYGDKGELLDQQAKEDYFNGKV